jgi:predicted tellurium resistance membrane protein TerC
VLKMVERFPLIVHAGAAVLAFTAARMIVGEPLLDPLFDHTAARWIAYVASVAGVLAWGGWATRRSAVGMPEGRSAADP